MTKIENAASDMAEYQDKIDLPLINSGQSIGAIKKNEVPPTCRELKRFANETGTNYTKLCREKGFNGNIFAWNQKNIPEKYHAIILAMFNAEPGFKRDSVVTEHGIENEAAPDFAEFETVEFISESKLIVPEIKHSNSCDNLHASDYSRRIVTRLANAKYISNFTTNSLGEFLDEVRSDKHKVLIENLRELYKPTIDPAHSPSEQKKAKASYDAVKITLPAYALTGTFNGKVENTNFSNSSGIGIIDIDHLASHNLTPEDVKAKLSKDCSIVMVITSPSGDGVKVLVAIPPVHNNVENKAIFVRLVAYFKGCHGLAVDTTGSDIRRLCFSCYDPEAYANFNAKIIDLIQYEPDSTPEKAPRALKEGLSPSNFVSIARVDAALRYVTDYSYEGWFKIAGALNYVFGEKGFDIFHKWSERDDSGYQCEEDCLKQYNAAKRTEGALVTCDSIFYQATQNGWDGSIDLGTALDHIEDSENRGLIVSQVAELTTLGLMMSDIHELVGAIVARGKLGRVKTDLVNEIKSAARKLFKNRTVIENKKIYPLSSMIQNNVFPDSHLTNNGVKIKPTWANLAVLLKAYGITCVYDVLLKEQTINIPGIHGCKALSSNANWLQVQSQLALNEIDIKTVNYLPIIFRDNEINPVLNWIEDKHWDGVDRLSQFYSTISTHVEYENIKNKILLVFLLQTIAACDNGEKSLRKDKINKFEYILTLQGGQGAAKTTWIRKLLPSNLTNYIKTSVLLDLKSKDSIKAAVSCWICELGELDATFRRSDIAALKAFTSNEVDEIRLPYDRLPNKYKRRTSFIASVNAVDFLHDPTGSRRFLTLGVTTINAHHSIDMQQLWAQVYQLYLDEAQWWPDSELDKLVTASNEYHTDRPPVIDLLELTFDMDKPNEGDKFLMNGVKLSMDTKQYCHTKTAIDLSTQAISRSISAHLTSKGFRSTPAREWILSPLMTKDNCDTVDLDTVI